MMKVSIVISNYNGRHLLERNLPAVIKACQKWNKARHKTTPGKAGWEIIVVDDASTDDSVAFLKENYPQVKLVVHQKNQRFAAACNTGVKKAKGRIVVLLNNDVSPEPDFLKPLAAHFKDPKVFAVGCKEKDIKDGKTVYSGRGLGEFRRGFLVHWRAKNQNRADTLWATAGSMALDRGKWLELGGMDTLFRPAYWEDIDLSWRARKRGWEILFEPRSIVNHHHETTNIAAFGKKKMKVFAHKNQFLFVWKNGDIKVLLTHLLWLPYHLTVTNWRTGGLLLIGFLLALGQLRELLVRKMKQANDFCSKSTSNVELGSNPHLMWNKVMRLSIIVPVYNEEKTIEKILDRLGKVKFSGVGVEKEVVVVDDGSTDNTRKELKILEKKFKKFKKFKVIYHPKNQGKGTAVRTGLNHAVGDYILIQDADLEYNPQDILRLLKPVQEGRVEVVYGSRLKRWPNLKKDERKLQFLLHYFGNRFLSLMTSLFYGQWITDMETGYKLFPKKALKDVRLKARRFDLEPEITSKLLKKGYRIMEVPIRTEPRGYEEGKKLQTMKDGSIAFWTLIKYRFFDD